MNLMHSRLGVALGKVIIVAGVALGATSPAFALDFLGDLIDSAKCAGASDVEACKAKSKAEYERHAAAKRGEASAPSQEDASVANDSGGAGSLPCWSDKWVVSVDVDTAFARAMGFIRYLTFDERRLKNPVLDGGFRYSATPGSRYDMADDLPWPALNGRKGGGWSELKLVRDGAQKTRVETKYCSIPALSTPAWRAHLRSGMESALAGG